MHKGGFLCINLFNELTTIHIKDIMKVKTVVVIHTHHS